MERTASLLKQTWRSEQGEKQRFLITLSSASPPSYRRSRLRARAACVSAITVPITRLSGALHRAVALATPTPAGLDDSPNVAPGRTPNMARQCSEIRDRPLHRRVLYLVCVSRASDISHLRYHPLVLLVDVADERVASFIDVDVLDADEV